MLTLVDLLELERCVVDLGKSSSYLQLGVLHSVFR